MERIVSRLTQTTEKNFTNKLNEWYEIYKEFLEEKSISSTTENFIILIQELEQLTEA